MEKGTSSVPHLFCVDGLSQIASMLLGSSYFMTTQN